MARNIAPLPTPEDLGQLETLVRFAFDRALDSLGAERDTLAFDKQTLRKFDVDGRMHVERCNISKANVCPYFGREIPDHKRLGLEPNRIYQLYRDPDELARGAATFRNLQLLMIHTGVNANDPKIEVTVGTIGSDVAFDAPFLTASIAVWTAPAIALIESKQQAELSCSYRYRADMSPGRTPEGVAFDGVMRDIMGNHVALVEKGRAGSDVIVSDSQPLELLPMFKRPNLLARAVALLATAPTDEQRLALDAALAATSATDCGPDAMDQYEDDPESPGKRRKKKANDAGVTPTTTPVTPGPKAGHVGMDAAAFDEALKAKGFITAADAQKLAGDAANAAVARVNALHKAREDVKPLVGIVAFDSAEEVYTFALKQSSVAVDGVPSGALGALVEQVKLRKSGTGAAPVITTPKLAADAAAQVSAAMPGVGRFAQG
jgi:hypothetical protein